MHLMTSPIDGSPMREFERYGVKMDICKASVGIWVDRGELEKIIIAGRERDLMDGGVGAQDAFDDVNCHESSKRTPENRPKRRKRDSLFENLLDIFD